MPSQADIFFLHPVGLLLTYLWTFVSLAAVQLTVRLIMRFDLRETALAALWLALAAAVIGHLFVVLTQPTIDPAMVQRLQQQGQASGIGDQAAFLYIVQQRLRWLAVPLLALAPIAWLVARRALGMRPRSAFVSAIALAVLLAPWPALALP